MWSLKASLDDRILTLGPGTGRGLGRLPQGYGARSGADASFVGINLQSFWQGTSGFEEGDDVLRAFVGQFGFKAGGCPSEGWIIEAAGSHQLHNVSRCRALHDERELEDETPRGGCSHDALMDLDSGLSFGLWVSILGTRSSPKTQTHDFVVMTTVFQWYV